MSDYEKAIKFLSNYVGGIDYRLECALKVPCRSFYEKMSDAIHTVLRAFRAQAEQSKGCIECEDIPNGAIKLMKIAGKFEYVMKIANEWLIVSYCPYCGRQLKEDAK